MTERNWNIVGVLGDIEIIDGDAHGPFTPICRVHERGDGKYWYTTSGDPRKEMVTWSLCEKPNLIAEWAWIERDGMPKPETKQELMSKAPLFGVDGEATR